MPSPFVARGEVLRLSNPGQLALLRSTLARGAALRTTVLGSSMRPFIRDGDVLTIAPRADRPPRVGDVVAFATSEPERLVIHRTVARVDGRWVTRGDAADCDDDPVRDEALLGRVVRLERGGRDVLVGGTRGGRAIAALSRHGLLGQARRAAHAVRAASRPARAARRRAAAVAGRVQALPAYRAAGRRLHPPYAVGVATQEEVAAVRRRLDADGPQPAPRAGPRVTDLVARGGGRVLGYAQYLDRPAGYHPWHGHWLASLVVWGPYRGLGVGEALVREAQARARAGGAAELAVAAFEDDTRAIGLYEKLGFTPVVDPGLEPVFAEDEAAHGRRRIVLRARLDAGGGRG